MKGLSGGEKKRCTIGYELITDPKVLLLDEPTSGLDSSSSLKIMKQMRREAQRGRAVLATIHQPSTELFNLFNKVIFLCNGHLVYQGSVANISPFLAEQSIQIAKFSNPADFMIRAIQAPYLVKKGLTKDDLVVFYKNKVDHAQEKREITQELELSHYVTANFDITQEMNSAKFTEIERQRKVNACQQWYLIFMRNLIYLLRNTGVVAATQINALILGGLMTTLYWNTYEIDETKLYAIVEAHMETDP